MSERNSFGPKRIADRRSKVMTMKVVQPHEHRTEDLLP